MPETKYYKVTQTREVQVAANSAVDASRIASAAFDEDQTKPGRPETLIDSSVWGYTRSRIKETSLRVTEGLTD